MSNFDSKLKEGTHFRVLHLPQNNPEMRQRDLAKARDGSAGSIYNALNELIAKGLFKMGGDTLKKELKPNSTPRFPDIACRE